jgi:hypothetical protein
VLCTVLFSPTSNHRAVVLVARQTRCYSPVTGPSSIFVRLSVMRTLFPTLVSMLAVAAVAKEPVADTVDAKCLRRNWPAAASRR